MQPERSGNGKKRCILAVGQQNRARSTRLTGSVRDRAIDVSFATSSSPIDNSITRRYAVTTFDPRCGSKARVQGNGIGVYPTQMTGFMESMN